MTFRSSSRRLQRAFTLVELLTVIAIIAILMGLLLPAIAIMVDRAHKADATHSCMAIVNAVRAYQTEYGKYPQALSTPPAMPADVIVGDTSTGGATAGNEHLFDVLRAIPNGTNASHALNPRKVVFFEGRSAKDPTAPKNGFATSGAFFDPWGAQYCVALDMDNDSQLTTLPYLDFNGATKGPRTGAAAYSLGKDGKLGLNGNLRDSSGLSDDVVTWQ